jgi:hypothetical protein
MPWHSTHRTNFKHISHISFFNSNKHILTLQIFKADGYEHNKEFPQRFSVSS